jgi:glycosyltransferase involved in cell wall biosynthesis
VRIALVHDYLNQRGGAERVFAHLARAYPDAPIYTSLFDPKETGNLLDASRVRASFLRRVPFANRFFRWLAPLYPAAFESFDLSAYDLVISTTTSWAKGVRIRSDAVHVCYIHTVSRFVFDYERYVGGFGLGTLARPLVRALARWDIRAAQRPTAFIANSRNVAARIKKYYGRDADVLPCPVDIDRFTLGAGTGDYAIVVSRLLPYKRIDLAIDACKLAGVPLKIVGGGPAEKALRKRAQGGDVEFLGRVDDATVNRLLGNARVAILPGEEDFGLVPLEAAAAGTPTIAYGRGGALETVLDGATGAIFDEPTAESLAAALAGFDRKRFDARRLRAHAEAFAPDCFVACFRKKVHLLCAKTGSNVPAESMVDLAL